MLHLLDVFAYRLVVEVWPLFWPLLSCVATLALVERALPLEPGQPWRAWWFNLVWHVLLLAFVVVMSWGVWGRFLQWAGDAPWVPVRLAPPVGTAGEFVRIAAALLVYDFFAYWSHRLQHAWPPLWAVHRFHHDERHVNASTSLRTHWLGMMLSQTLVLVPMMWVLGLEAMSLPVYLVIGMSAAVAHLNVDLGLGPLTKLVVGPRYHRLHHARERALHDGNYAALLPLWDLLFGTYHPPIAGRHEATGLPDIPASDSLWRAAVRPLEDWWRMWRRRPLRT